MACTNLTSREDNHTYSIDLTSSWTNATVRLHQIEKAAPVLVSEALWADDSGKGFYAYDGGVSWSLPANELPGPPGNSLWQYVDTFPELDCRTHIDILSVE